MRSNLLINEKSPYLLQHAHNPVDWHPWADDAFKKAEKEDKPVFLSIGYSTCHWCHVMERESFEDEGIASIMNENFINIKVDREERPDIDHIYMTAVQIMGHGGGWPLSAFLTPDKKPFFGGSYFPPHDMPGMPGFASMLQAVSLAWKTKRQELVEHADRVLGSLASKASADGARPGEEALLKAAAQLAGQYDREFGGFLGAVKFPMGHRLSFLLRVWHRFKDGNILSMAGHTLDRMSWGGVYDHCGGGFHRYSTERTWLVPHFEKMLYDQALLACAYTDAFLVTGKQDYRRVVREILAYVSDSMMHTEGGFFSAEDADSEGSEGKFYLWSMQELIDELGKDDGGLFCRYYGVMREGNFEGRNILAVRRAPEEFAQTEGIDPVELTGVLQACRLKLRAVRDRRIRPFRDDKILTDWNGLMISAFAYASRALQVPEYAKTSSKAAEFILSHCRGGDGRLLKRWYGGEAGGAGLLADYAFFCNGLIDVYEATFEPVWLVEARKIAHDMVLMFGDPAAGGFFTGPKDGEKLLFNPKEIFDGAIPSGNSAALMVLTRLAHITGETALEEPVEHSFALFRKEIEALPSAIPCMMTALDYHLGPRREVVIAPGKSEGEAEALAMKVYGRFSPRTVVLLHTNNEAGRLLETVAPFTKDLGVRDGKTTLYLCENFTCKLPATGTAEALGLLDKSF